MPLEQVPEVGQQFWMLCYDEQGRERREGADGPVSERVIAALGAEPVTDLFLFCHGWRNDLPAARMSYRQWVTEMARHQAGVTRMRAARPGFRPLLVGIHWPSQPFGDEDLPPLEAGTVGRWEDYYIGRVSDTDAGREELRTVLAAAAHEQEPRAMPEAVADAYRSLSRASGLASEGFGAAPGVDHDPFDPVAIYADAGKMLGDGAVKLWRGVLSGLGLLSFWKMKDRARALGESGARALLERVIHARPDVRIHLMGHSFGSIVLSSMVAGPLGQGWLPRPVQSLVMVQGALSLWSFSARLPFADHRPGYFHRVLSGGVVDGPILTTQSSHDTAVGLWYRLGARIGPIDYAPGPDLPRYGSLGAFGAHGEGVPQISELLHPVDAPYRFRPGYIYNLNADQVICRGGWPTGAHGDFAHPEVAHAVWSAALPGDGSVIG